MIIVADLLVKNNEGIKLELPVVPNNPKSNIINPRAKGQHKLIGDFFCIIASILYASSNVGVEYFMRETNSKREYLAMIGLFGTLISCLQMFIFERNEILSLINSKTSQIWFLFGINSVFMFSIYTLLPCVIAFSSASFLNVNLLSADFYSVLFGIYIKKYEVKYFF